MWPEWKFIYGTLICTPSVAVLNTFFKAGHEEVMVAVVGFPLTRIVVKADWHYTCRMFFFFLATARTLFALFVNVRS